jgi:hypothetical protein
LTDCPDCGYQLNFLVADDREDAGYTHLYEFCAYCGYTKSFVDYGPDE